MMNRGRFGFAGALLTSALGWGCTGEVSSSSSPGVTAPAGGVSSNGASSSGVSNTATPGAGAPQSAGGTTGLSPSATGGRPTGTAGSAAGAPPVSGPPDSPGVVGRAGLAARISKVEYEHSLLDVLGVSLTVAELDAASGGIPDDAGDGVFKHIADKQTSIEQHALAYFQTAHAVAERVDVPVLSTRLGACTQTTVECGTAMISALGRLLYRRPLAQREVEAMLGVFNAALIEKLDYAGAMRWTIRALIQTPQFLFRTEDEVSGTAGQARDLTGYELAARLASFLWVSVPDAALLASAADGSLNKPDVLQTEVARMLADPKAQRLTRTFMADFSRARFASFEGATDEDRFALNESVVETFQDHLWTQRGSVADLFVTKRWVVNPRVAELLGITMTGTGLQTVDVSSLPQRVGLLSHPGMIAGMGDRGVGSFVNRGKYLMERLLCRNPIAVPAELLEELENFNADTTGLNEHERAAIRKTRPVCWSCHTQFEPFAFGFSRFDGAGRYIGEQDVAGKPLPLDGWVPTASEANSPHYTDVASYMQILAKEPVVQTCMTEHFIAFATSRTSDIVARGEAERVGKEYIAGGSTLPAMISAVVASPLFKTIVAQAAP
jgi:hypothetical protein